MNLGFDLKDWEEVEAVEMGDREVLELGGHEVVILDVSLYKSEQTGNTSLKVSIDIAGNDKQKGFFKKQYDNNKVSEAKWPAGGTKYLSLKKESLQYTKGFVKALENSNPNFKFDTNKEWNQIKGLKCAAQFGLEEYLDSEGKTKAATKLIQFRSLDKLGEIQVPNVKLLDGTYVSVDDYNEFYRNKKQDNILGIPVEIKDSDLPF